VSRAGGGRDRSIKRPGRLGFLDAGNVRGIAVLWPSDLIGKFDLMQRTRMVVLIRAVQLLVSMVVAVVAVDLVIGISRPETRGVVKLELAALVIISFTVVALAVSAAARLHRGDRHRKV